MLTETENLVFVLSGIGFLILSFMILGQVCTKDMYWSNAFISDQFSACADHPSFEWLGWVFVLLVSIQTGVLLRIWTRHYHFSGSYNLWFHMLAFHFTFSFPCA